MWKKHDEASHFALYTFINNKQYDDFNSGGGGGGGGAPLP